MSSLPLDPAAPLWDLSYLLEQLGGDSEDLAVARELARTFVARFPESLRDLEQALATGEAALLARVAHQIKGICAIFAAAPCVARAQRLETLAGAGEMATALVEGRELLQMLRLLVVEIGNFAAGPLEPGVE
ncbi:MAG TPA: Hpt domain-containing protein [Azospira sp.]|nr:Hpt domain-containing protein [Azospira sp.]